MSIPKIDPAVCIEKIRWVAAAIHESNEFESRASIAASELGTDSIETLPQLFQRVS